MTSITVNGKWVTATREDLVKEEQLLPVLIALPDLYRNNGKMDCYYLKLLGPDNLKRVAYFLKRNEVLVFKPDNRPFVERYEWTGDFEPKKSATQTQQNQ